MNQDHLNNNQANQGNSSSSVPEWFQQTNAPLVIPPTASPKKSRRLTIVIISLLLILTTLVLGYLYISSRSTNCFNASNYSGLVDIVKTVDSDSTDANSLQPQELFYAHAVYFQQDATDFNTERADDPTTFLQSLGAFNQKDYTAAPIAVQIDTQYTTPDSLELAQKRVARVKSMLLQAGVAASAVHVSQPILVPLTDETAEDDDLRDSIPVFVSITPLSSCKTQD